MALDLKPQSFEWVRDLPLGMVPRKTPAVTWHPWRLNLVRPSLL